MAEQIVIVLCEGPHDVAFINRILKTIGFKSNEKVKLGEYPSPINRVIENEVTKTNVAELNLVEIRRNLLPSSALLLDQDYIFLYSLGGDGKKDSRQKLLKTFSNLVPDEGEISTGRIQPETTLSILYFFDADENGVAQRITDINQEVSEALPEVNIDLFENNAQLKTISNIKIGNYIFTGENNNTGKLEDILVPLMKQDNDKIFDEAESYLEENFDEERLFPLKISVSEEGIFENRSNKNGDKEKHDKKKSLIGTVGQLQKSGKSNVVCISDSDLLNIEKINNTDSI